MRVVRTCVVVVLLSLVGATVAEAADSELEGTWQAKTLVSFKGERADDFVKNLQWTFNGEKFTISVGERSSVGKFTLNTTSKPKQIDVGASEGSNITLRVKGIYQLDGDNLTVCYFPDGILRMEERPSEMKGGDGHILMTMKRVKK